MPPSSPKQPEEKETNQFDGLDVQTEKLTHPTANRAKPPQRRPPSGLVTAAHVCPVSYQTNVDVSLLHDNFDLKYEQH